MVAQVLFRTIDLLRSSKAVLAGSMSGRDRRANEPINSLAGVGRAMVQAEEVREEEEGS